MKVERDFSFAVSYVNKGDLRSNGYYCSDFSSLSKAEKMIKESFENNPDMNGYYVISLLNKQDVNTDIITVHFTNGILKQTAI